MTTQLWTQFGALIILESAALALTAAVLARLLRKPRAQALVWQTVFAALAAMLVMRLGALELPTKLGQPVQRTVRIEILDPAPESLQQSAHAQPVSQAKISGGFAHLPLWIALSGTALCLFRIIVSRQAVARALLKSEAPLESLSSIAEDLRARIGGPRFRLIIWSALPAPCAFGVGRPHIALPKDLPGRVSRAQMEAILAHEIAHLAARDPQWLLFAELLTAALWWNPAVWMARHALLGASERAADQACQFVPNGGAVLAESLIALGRELAGSPARSLPVLGGVGLRSDLSLRVKALLDQAPEWQPVRRQAWAQRALCFALLAGFAAPLPHAQLPAPLWSLLQPARTEKAEPQDSTSPNPAEASPADAQNQQPVQALQEPRIHSRAPLSQVAEGQPQSSGYSTSAVATITDILTDPQFKAVVQALQQAGGPREPGQNPTPADTARKAVTLRIEMVEIAEESGPGLRSSLGLDWLFGEAGDKQPVRVSVGEGYRLPGNQPLQSQNIDIDHLRVQEQSAILAANQFAKLKAQLEKTEGIDMITAPKVTTLAGRQAQISIQDIQTIVIGLTNPPTATREITAAVATEVVYFGSVIDVTPQAVGDQWLLPVTASLVEFLGYPDGTRPHIRVRDAVATQTVSIGETLLIRGVPVSETRKIKGGFLRRDRAEEVRKRLYIFVTPEPAK